MVFSTRFFRAKNRGADFSKRRKLRMKKPLFCMAFAGLLSAPLAYASNVDFNVGINIGNRPPVVVPAPPPPVYAPPVPVAAPPVVIEEPPEFIEPPQLGFYAAVGVPYNLYFAANQYYLFKGNAWYAAPRYNGPWVSVRYASLPGVLRRYPHEKIQYYRDAGYRHYRGGGDPYWEKHRFHPEKVWKEQRKAEKEYRKEQRRAEKEDWKEAKRQEKEYRDHDRGHGRGH
jgi:hypothetical protein